MKRFIITIVCSFVLSISVFARTDYASIKLVPLDEYTIPQLIDHFAVAYNVSPETITTIMKCESSFNTQAVGDHGTSYGLSQIHLPAHPEVSKEQALDKVFAVEFMAKAISEGHIHMWSCARIHRLV